MVDVIMCGDRTHISTHLLPRAWLVPLQGSHFWNPIMKGHFIEQILQEFTGRGCFSLYLLIPKMERGIYLLLALGGTNRLPQAWVQTFAPILPAPGALSVQNTYCSTTTQRGPGDTPGAHSGAQTHLWKGVVIHTPLSAFVLCEIPSCGDDVHPPKPHQGWFGFNHTVMSDTGFIGPSLFVQLRFYKE